MTGEGDIGKVKLPSQCRTARVTVLVYLFLPTRVFFIINSNTLGDGSSLSINLE